MSDEHRPARPHDSGSQGPDSPRHMSPPETDEVASSPAMDRRSFLKRTGAGAGTLAMAAGVSGLVTGCGDAPADGTGVAPSIATSGRGRDVVVVGAGTFGVWTAYYLQQMGARVTLVDLYGPGNSRSTSGDETRGIRTAYGDRRQWTDWARRSIQRWKDFDAEFARDMGGQVYFPTGDLILRDEWGDFLEQTRTTWDGLGIGYEVLDMDEVRYRWPALNPEGLEVALYEPDAGVARARAAIQRVAALVRNRGGELRIARALPGAATGGRLNQVRLEGEGALGGDTFVFALGPWFAKTFPDIMGGLRIPMGNVYYFGTPPGDERFSWPNLPSWGIAGVTGWANLPPDQRGFRVRTGGRPGDDPDTSMRWIPEEYHEQAREMLTLYFPDMADAPLIETRACHYEFSATRDWIVDRHPEWENVWIAGGGNAEGFKFGPMLGELIAGRVLGDDRFPEVAELFKLNPPTTGDGAG